MAEKISIGRIVSEDWQLYRALRLDALLESPAAFATIFEEERSQSDDNWISKVSHFALSEKQRMFVAKTEDRMVGMMGLVFDPRHKRRHIATMVSVYITPDFRGKGISKLLMAAMLDDVWRVPYIRKVQLLVNPKQTEAIGLYKAFGFHEVGKLEKEVEIDETYFDMLLMEQWLPDRSEAPEKKID